MQSQSDCTNPMTVSCGFIVCDVILKEHMVRLSRSREKKME